MIKITDEQVPYFSEGKKVYLKYKKRVPRLSEELFAEMLFGVNHANLILEKNIREGRINENPGAYVRVTVKGFLNQYLANQRLFVVSRNTFIKKGGKIAEREYRSLDGIDRLIFKNCKSTLRFTCDKEIEGVNNHPLDELRDTIESCYCNDRERFIMERKIDGCTDEEIASKINLTRQRVTQIVNDFKRKLECKLMNGERNLMKCLRPSPRKEISLQLH